MKDLIESIFRDKEHYASHRLLSWAERCDRFRDFFILYQNKISKKVRKAKTNEDLGDVIAELFVAYLFLQDQRIMVEYEKFGLESRGPDLSAFFEQAISFNVEVARIRNAELEMRFNNVIKQINRRVCAGPSYLEFEIRLEMPTVSQSLIQHLEQATDEIVWCIERTIEREFGTLAYKKEHRYPISGFEGILTLILYKHSFDPEFDGTAFSRFSPVAYTQREHHKFGDIIVNKLKQLPLDNINVIFIISDSNAHEPEDLKKGITSLFQALNQGNQGILKKVVEEFGSIENFKTQMQKLGGVIFRSKWREHNEPNVLWCNPQASEPLPEAIKQFLIHSDYPRL